VFAQLPIYFFMALSEIFANVSALEFAYEQAPPSMKSLVMAFSLFQTAIGSALGLLLSPIVIETNFMWLFFSLGVTMLMFAVGFAASFAAFYEK
jgi:POT family proton-dependent oligopeptide transporter